MTQCSRCTHLEQWTDDVQGYVTGGVGCGAVEALLQGESEAIRGVSELTLFALAGMDSCPCYCAKGDTSALTERRRLQAKAAQMNEEAYQQRISELEAQVRELTTIVEQYKRNAAYVAACVDSDGCYRP